MSKDLQEEITTMIYNYGLGVGPDSGTLACRIISKVKHSLTPRAPDVLPCGHPKSSALLLEFGSWSCQDCKRQNAGKA